MEITKAQFLLQRHRRFGRSNPERMDVPFWEMMVRNGKGAYWARELFTETYEEHTAPVWCFNRYGMSETTLSDGRKLCIGGEHEDFYDPDFCIYNDLVVKHPDNRIEIFGYPKEVFPPTDFHSATLVEDRIILIGNLGYSGERRLNHTPIYALHLAEHQITPLATSGTPPGWIHRHEATIGSDGRITICGGEVLIMQDGKQTLRRNVEDFALDLATGQWEQTTARKWRQFSIRPEQRHLISRPWKTLEAICLRTIPHDVAPDDEWNKKVLLVEGVPISLTLAMDDLRLVIEGSLQHDLANRVAEEARASFEAAIDGRTVKQEL